MTHCSTSSRRIFLTKNKCRRVAATICLRPLQIDSIFIFIHQVAPVPTRWLFKTSATSWLTCDLLTLKVVSESHVMWATSVPILVFLGLSVLDLDPMYATDRRHTDRRQTKALLNASVLWGRRHNKLFNSINVLTRACRVFSVTAVLPLCETLCQSLCSSWSSAERDHCLSENYFKLF